MKTILILLVLLPVTCFSQRSVPQTVSKVDLKKYAGLWYEIKKIPNRFQKHCISGTTARYNLREDGKIEVINSCTDEDGEKDVADGIARIVDRNSKAKLEVSFFSILGWRPFWGDYWIIGLDNDYKWAIVGTPDRKYGWVLSRSDVLENETMNAIDRILVEQGYDPADFMLTPH